MRAVQHMSTPGVAAVLVSAGVGPEDANTRNMGQNWVKMRLLLCVKMQFADLWCTCMLSGVRWWCAMPTMWPSADCCVAATDVFAAISARLPSMPYFADQLVRHRLATLAPCITPENAM